MKPIIACIAVLFIFKSAQSQSTYYDAVKLKSYSRVSGAVVKLTADNRAQRDTIIAILRKYFPTIDTTLTAAQVGSILRTNPFLTNFSYSGATEGGGSTPTNTSLGSIASSIGGLDVTNIADGFAKFLVKRTKEELTISVFNKFKEFISKPEYVDLRTVFPQTYQALTIIGDEIYNYQAYIQTLRESFEADLKTLPVNLPSIIANHPAFFNAHKDLAAILNSGCYLAQQLKDKVHPGDILAAYPVNYLDDLNKNWKGGIQTLQLISESLRDTAVNTDSVYWVSTKQIKGLVTDTLAFKIYLGLVYQTAKTFNKDSNNNSIPIYFEKDTLTNVLAKINSKYMQLSGYVTNFGDKANKLSTLIKQFKKPANDSLAIQYYYDYTQATINFLRQAAAITDVPAINNILKISLAGEMKDYFDVAQSSSDIVLNISKRNYSAAIVNVVHVYDLIKAKQANIDVTAKENATTASAGNAATEALSNQDTLNKLKAVPGVKSSLFKYGSFMAAMVQANNSDDVENVIETFALPSGSSTIKRESEWNIALNAYVGPYIGKEKIKGLDAGDKVNAWGITAPVGISISEGRSFLFFFHPGWHSSSSIFFSLVDLGAVTAFRFNDDKTSSVPTIQLKDIVSPGIFYSHGFGKTPLSLNIGWQMGPLLREVKAQANTYSNQYSRFSISLCVDIPVLNFYSKSR